MYRGSRAPLPRRGMVSLAYLLISIGGPAAVPAGAGRAAAVDEPMAALREAWRWRVFDRHEGVPGGPLTALYQERVGLHIYAAAKEGLARYDLWEWSPVAGDAAFRGEPVRKFVESAFRSSLYAATRTSLWSLRGGAPPRLVYPGNLIHAAESPAGDVFLIDAVARKHFQVRGDALDLMDPAVQLPPATVLDYAVDSSRSHWLATSAGLFVRVAGDRAWQQVRDRDLASDLRGLRCSRFFRVQSPRSGETDSGVRGPLPWDELWAFFESPEAPGSGGHLARLDRESWEPMSRLDGSAVQAIVSDSRRRYYATGDDGVLIVSRDGRSWTPVEEPGLGKVAIHAELVDSAGVLWFRTGTGDVAAFDPEATRWETIPTGSREAFPNVLSLIGTQEGDVWIGTTRGLSRRHNNGVSESFETVHGVPRQRITGLAEDSDRRIWISGEFPGVLCYNESIWIRESVPGLKDHPVRKIVKDRLGELWFLSEERSSDDGWVIYRRSLYTSYRIVPVRVPHGPVNDLVRAGWTEAGSDVFWLATEQGLLQGTVDDETFRVSKRYTEENGLRSRVVFGLTEGPDGAVWLCYPGYSPGVTRLRAGEVTHFAVDEGPPSPYVWSLASSGQNLWFGTDRGLTRFDGECWYDYRVASNDPRSGRRVFVVASPETPGDPILVGTWGLGAFRFRLDNPGRKPRVWPRDMPDKVGRDGTAAMSWDGRDHRNDTPPDRLVFRSQLDSEAWTPFSSARSRVLSGLAPGTHFLRVEVRDLDGNRNRDDLVHRFVVAGSGDGVTWWLGAAAGSVLLVLLAVRLGPAILARRRRRRLGPALIRRYPGLILLVDGRGRILDASGDASDLLGSAAGSRSPIGRPAEELPIFAERELRAAFSALLEGEPFLVRTRGPASGSGEERVLELRGIPLRRRPGRPAEADRRRHASRRPASALAAAVFVEDGTARSEESALQERGRRLNSLRTFTARILSIFGGVLASPGLRDLLRDEPQVGERMRSLEEILGRLGDFAGRGGDPSAWTRVSIHDLLDGLIGGSASGSGCPGLRVQSGVRIDFRGQASLWTVRGDPDRLREALLEVLENAADSMPERGTLTVRTSNSRIDHDPGSLPPGAYVEIVVRDTGAGILPSQMDSMFEPFYSTKPRDQAEGVGLAVTYGIIRAHGGDVRISSRPGQGTTVRVVLPAWQES